MGDSNAPPAFRNPTSLTNWTQGFLYASLAVGLVSVYTGIADFLAYDDVWWERWLSWMHGLFNPLAFVQRMAWGIFAIVVFIGTSIVVLLWIHRANSNARALGATGMTFTPGWAVGWYFVPIAWWWKPYQAMRETWCASADPANWRRQRVPPILGWWWALWIVSFWVLVTASWAVPRGMEEARATRVESLFNIAIDVLDIPLALVFLAIVGRIHAMQMELWSRQRAEAVAAEST